jgi:hypothetical protein
MPSSVEPELGFFDRFADRSAHLVSRAPFFALSVMLVVTWLVEGIVLIARKGSFSAFIGDSYHADQHADDDHHVPARRTLA